MYVPNELDYRVRDQRAKVIVGINNSFHFSYPLPSQIRLLDGRDRKTP